MVIIANVNKIVALTEKEVAVFNTLTPKDRLYIVTEANALIPIALFNILAGLKSKPEIVSLPVGADSHAEAFLYGIIAAGVKSSEEIKILADMELSFPSMDNIKWVTSLTGGKTVVKKTKPSAGKIVDVPEVKNTTSNTQSASDAPVKRTRKPKAEDEATGGGTLYKKLIKYPGLKDMDSLLREKETDILYCIQNASDSEIGLKFLLETKLGLKDGDTIWAAIHDDYENLKKLIG